MKVYPPCLGCGAALRSSHDPPQSGVRRHGGHGYCDVCRMRQRRGEPVDDDARAGFPWHVPAWFDDALCTQVDGDLFFPEKGGSVRPAKAVCGRCEVRAACLQLALERREPHGVWGGVSAKGRRRMLKEAS